MSQKVYPERPFEFRLSIIIVFLDFYVEKAHFENFCGVIVAKRFNKKNKVWFYEMKALVCVLQFQIA